MVLRLTIILVPEMSSNSTKFLLGFPFGLGLGGRTHVPPSPPADPLPSRKSWKPLWSVNSWETIKRCSITSSSPPSPLSCWGQSLSPSQMYFHGMHVFPSVHGNFPPLQRLAWVWALFLEHLHCHSQFFHLNLPSRSPTWCKSFIIVLRVITISFKSFIVVLRVITISFKVIRKCRRW